MKSNILINIHEFGPLREQLIEFAPFLVFTGNSGLGKSYANYLVYYMMRSLTSETLQPLLSKKIKKDSFELSLNEVEDCLNSHVEDFMRDFLGFHDLTCCVEYCLYDREQQKVPSYGVTIEKRNFQVDNPNVADHFEMLSIKINGEESRVVVSSDAEIDKSFVVASSFSQYIQRQLFGSTISRAVILPPARGAIVGENYSLKESITSSCKMYDYFLRDYELSQRSSFLKRKEDEESSFYANRVKNLLHGDLISEKGIQYLIIGKDKRVPLTAAASSIKELSPFLFFLKNHSNKLFSFCIEEPEAHLHPTMQVSLADLIAACRNKGMMFQMTTHSDYFIQRINQLLRLGRLQLQDPASFSEFQTMYKWNRRFYLQKDDVVCYFFHEDNKGRVCAEKLEIEDGVLPMKTFYQAINELSAFEEYLKDF